MVYHQNKRAVRCPDRGDQLFTEVIPLLGCEVQVVGNKATEGINQNRLPGSQAVDHAYQLCPTFRNAPMVGPPLPVGLQTLLPITVIRPGGRRGDVGDNGVVFQQVLSPAALATAGWSTHQDQPAGLAGNGGLH